MSGCNHDYGSCGADRDSREIDKGEFLEALNPASSVKRAIGVVSSKGGVGKSLITSMLAVSMNRRDKKTAVLDVDIIGPSIPMAFGVGNEGVAASPNGSLTPPARSMEGTEIMFANLPLDKDTNPIIWRGPVVAGAVKQFWSKALWQDMDYMFVDMPPGTSGVPLIVFQFPPVDDIIIVTSPQELVGMVVAKAVNIAKKMDIPAVSVVESMNYLECPDCGERISVSGEGHVEEIAAERDIKVLAQIPISPATAQMVDAGRVEYLEIPWFDETVKAVEAL